MVLVPVLAIAAYVLSRDAWHMLDEEKLTYEKLSVQVLDGDDRLFSALGGGEERLLMDIEDLPAHVKNAFIAAEDVVPTAAAHELSRGVAAASDGAGARDDVDARRAS